MTRLQFLLLKLAEEASEVAQAAMKAALYGLQNGQYDNYDNLRNEVMDLEIVIGELEDLDLPEGVEQSKETFEEIAEILEKRREKLNHHFEIAKAAHGTQL
jgi:NTP pyrophosphatase (non-canonical NTP hydrolase)